MRRYRYRQTVRAVLVVEQDIAYPYMSWSRRHDEESKALLRLAHLPSPQFPKKPYLLLGGVVPSQILKRWQKMEKNMSADSFPSRKAVNTYETDSFVRNCELQANSTNLGRDEDHAYGILRVGEVCDRLISVSLRHDAGVSEASNVLFYKMILDKVNRANELREDDDLVFFILCKPLVDQIPQGNSSAFDGRPRKYAMRICDVLGNKSAF
jgi:hypothetical protein